MLREQPRERSDPAEGPVVREVLLSQAPWPGLAQEWKPFGIQWLPVARELPRVGGPSQQLAKLQQRQLQVLAILAVLESMQSAVRLAAARHTESVRPWPPQFCARRDHGAARDSTVRSRVLRVANGAPWPTRLQIPAGAVRRRCPATHARNRKLWFPRRVPDH